MSATAEAFDLDAALAAQPPKPNDRSVIPPQRVPKPESDQDETPLEGEEIEQSDEPESDEETPDEGDEEETPPSAAVGGFTREEDVPEPLRGQWRSMQADYTKKTQELADVRRLADEFRRMGVTDFNTFTQQLRQYASGPYGGQFQNGVASDPFGQPPLAGGMNEPFPPQAPYTPQPPTWGNGAQPFEEAPSYDNRFTPPTVSPAPSPSHQDPEVAEAQADYDLARETYGDNAVETRMAARQLRTLTQLRHREQEQARFLAWQQQQARSQSLSQELSRLQADPRYARFLADPQAQASLVHYVRSHPTVSLEDAVKVQSYEWQAAEAYKVSSHANRTQAARQKALDTSLPTSQSTRTVRAAQEVPSAVRKEGIQAILDYKRAHGMIDF